MPHESGSLHHKSKTQYYEAGLPHCEPKPQHYESDLPYYSINSYLRDKFGCKVAKLSIDAGFTCPNRDGSKGTGGCIFCSASGSGDTAGDIPGQIELLSKKWNVQKYIAYFQNHTNTYAATDELRGKFYPALSYPGVVGLAIATRPDCLGEDVLDLLDELNRKTFLWIELGLQTMHDETAGIINRCYSLSDFDNAVENLSRRNIKAVVHLIFGLPGETTEQMLSSVKYVCGANPFGIKIHLMNVIKGSAMEKLYPGYVPFPCINEYVGIVADALEIIKKRADKITRGYRITWEPPILRHFQARLEPLG